MGSQLLSSRALRIHYRIPYWTRPPPYPRLEFLLLVFLGHGCILSIGLFLKEAPAANSHASHFATLSGLEPYRLGACTHFILAVS